MQNEIKFSPTGNLRILQVSDPQDLKYIRRSMLRMLDSAYDILRPDLVLLTGDNILGNHLLDARIGNKKVAEGREATLDSMKAALKWVLDPLEKRHIPFAMVYGNHDDMNVITKEEQMEIYRSCSCCMKGNTDNPDLDVDTYAIKCIGRDGKNKFTLFMLDSAWQDKDEKRECHTEVKREAVEWYISESEKQREENGGENVPAMMFLHVPFIQTTHFVRKCSKGDKNAFRCGDGWYCLNTEYAEGTMGEYPSVLHNDNGLYEAVKEQKNVIAVAAGHDHLNNFTGMYEGIEFIQTGCASFRCYGNRATRGVRVIDIKEDGTYTSKFYNYFDLCGKSIPSRIAYFMDSDENEKKKFVSLGVAAIAAVAGLTAKAIAKGAGK